MALFPAAAEADTDPGPPLETPVTELAKGLHCPTDQPDTGKPTVLFTPGTGFKGEEPTAKAVSRRPGRCASGRTSRPRSMTW